MIDGALSMMAMHLPLWKTRWWPARGDGLLAGDKPFYRTFACADGRFVAVGALERGFFEALWRGLDLGDVPDHMNAANWPHIEASLARRFGSRPRDAWAEHFGGTDACVTPVLDPDEVWDAPQVSSRHPGCGPQAVPAVPRLSRTPARAGAPGGDQSRAILSELGLDEDAIAAAMGPPGDVARSGLEWPPDLT